MKSFELWIDESGDFQNEEAKRLENKSPSMVGGILLEAHIARKLDFNAILDMNKNHANKLSDSLLCNYVVPALEKLRDEYGAREVFFENASYSEGDNNRQLYLHIIAEGILQLIQDLNARYSGVELKVVIARRRDVTKTVPAEQEIKDSEYQTALKRTIDNKKRERKIFFDDSVSLGFQIAVATRDERLILADFACNTRLTRKRKAFKNMYGRVLALYDNAIIYNLHELDSENTIRQYLADNRICDALIELFTTVDEIDIDKNIKVVVERMKNNSYRIVKSQMKQFSREVIGIISKEDDYELGESFLNTILDCFCRPYCGPDLPLQQLQFDLLLYLSDMYLREGAILEAKTSIEECERTQKQIGCNMEDVFSYYQIMEKKALLYIDAFAYEKAAEHMNKISESFQKMIAGLREDENLKSRFPQIKSEYFGDVLCMQIYAMMFLQRHNPKMYGQLCQLSDLALTQYPSYEGELERHRQYRSHIELEEGNCQSALQWLIKAKQYKDVEINKENIMEFLDAVSTTEVPDSQLYYLMYYLLIMKSAKKRDCELADMMYHCLVEQKKMLAVSSLKQYVDIAFQDVNMEGAKEYTTSIQYHPVEIILWKFASYISNRKKNDACEYYERAVTLCFQYENYVTMRITGIGISAEYIAFLEQEGKHKKAISIKKKLGKAFEKLLQEELPDETGSFVEKLHGMFVDATQNEDTYDIEKLLEIADTFTY